jgi:RHS repeat-associated protein
VTFAYQFNRVTAITYPNFPANNVTYTYGAGSQRSPGLVGNVVGRITHITDGAGTEDRRYGPLGEIVQETRAIPIQGNQVATYVTRFQYDTWNRIRQIIYPDDPPDGEVVTYFYDYGGLVTRVHGNDDKLQQDYATNIAYDKFGQRLQMVYGNGVTTAYAYRADNRRLLNVQATLPIGYTFHNFNFTYDKVGNLTQLQNTAQMPGSFTGGSLGNNIGGPWTKTYVYDDLYQLTSSTGTHNIAATPTYAYSFSQSYDSIHNITHKTQTAMQNTAVNPKLSYDWAYTYPAPWSAHPHGPTAIGAFNITNDANGNQVTTKDTGTGDESQYLYDEENRLACANKGSQVPSPSCDSSDMTDFVYDHAGERKVKASSSPTIYPNQYFTDFGGGSGNQFKHIFIGSERILTKKARIAPDREHWYYHADHLGSTATVTNEKAQLVDAVHYFPFGEVWLEERPSSLPTDYFFTAKELDQETGFYDFGARYLDPRFSKWMTADPALGEFLPGAGVNVPYQSPSLANNWQGHSDLPGMGGAFQPANLALYGYGHQNPSTLIDPNGRNVVPCSVMGYNLNLGNCESLRAGIEALAANPSASGRAEETISPLDFISLPRVGVAVAREGGEAAAATVLRSGSLWSRFATFAGDAWFRWIDRAGVWKMASNTERGNTIERILAATEYKGWSYVGKEHGGFSEVVDFAKDNVFVSLKSKNTSLPKRNWYYAARREIKELNRVDELGATKIYDLRVQPGGAAAAEPLIEYGRTQGVTVIIKEFR